jgi:hypothetical protein
VHGVADVGQHKVSAAVGGKLLGSRGLDQHRQRAYREKHRRDRSGDNCHACHADDATKRRPPLASGQLPILQKPHMGGFPYPRLPVTARLDCQPVSRVKEGLLSM